MRARRSSSGILGFPTDEFSYSGLLKSQPAPRMTPRATGREGEANRSCSALTTEIPKMATKLTKEQSELRVFESLLPLTGRLAVPGSIQQNKPPAPDIECVIQGGGLLAVELVALDDDETRTRLGNMYATQEAWQRALARHPAPAQSRLIAECSDAFVNVAFDNAAGLRDRTAIMKSIQDELLRRPPGFSGTLSAPNLPPTGATVHRGHVVNGPRIFAFSVSSPQPIQTQKIREKLVEKAPYQTTAPLELFGYSVHDDVDAFVHSRATIDACVNAHLPGSQFARVKIFNFGTNELKFEYP